VPASRLKPRVQKSGDQPRRNMATSEFARASSSGCARKRQLAKTSGSTPELPKLDSAATSRPAGVATFFGPPSRIVTRPRPMTTCRHAHSGIGSSDDMLAPLAIVRETDVKSMLGRKTLKTHLARLRVVAASSRPTRVASTPRPQHVRSSVTALSDETSTAGCNAGMSIVGVPPPRQRRTADW
jgi:hypothetical protein